jgi:hypothetical protein
VTAMNGVESVANICSTFLGLRFRRRGRARYGGLRA